MVTPTLRTKNVIKSLVYPPLVDTQVVDNDCLAHYKRQETSVVTLKFGPKAFWLALVLLKMSCGFVDYDLSDVFNI